MTDERLIDDVARSLMDHPPVPALRGRVLARIAAPSRRTRIHWLLPAAAAATLGVVAVATLRHGPETASHSTALVRLSSAVSPTAPATTPSARMPNTESPRVAQSVRRTVARQGATGNPNWMERIVPPLERPSSITFDTIQPIELSIAPITVELLVTEPLAVPPITGGAGTIARN